MADTHISTNDITESLKISESCVDFLLNFYNYILVSNHIIKPSLFDIISKLETIKDSKYIIKEYNTLYKYDNHMLELFTEEIKLISNYDKILNLYSGLGFLTNIVNQSCEYNSLLLYEQDDKLVQLGKILFKDPKICVRKTDILHSNDISDQYDLIVSDVPDNIKNIIYAKLCPKIKELKIRGTKAEPLFVQLVCQLLRPGGKAVLIIPNNFLFGDSKQHVETRKFIYENSSNIKVINLSSKKSIFIMIKSDLKDLKTEFTIWNQLSNQEIKVSNQEIKVSNEQIIANLYSYYYSSYIDELNTKTSFNEEKITIGEIVQIYSQEENSLNLNDVPVLYSYSNTNFAIDQNPDKYDYVFIIKDNTKYNQQFINWTLMFMFEKNIDLLVKGKTNMLCTEKIKKFKIYNYSIEYQNNIINLLENSEKINRLAEAQEQNILKICKLKISNLNFPCVKLNTIATISNVSDGKSIGVYKNSSQAGRVFITNEPTKSDNIYFITPSDDNFTHDFLYIYLKLKEEKLIDMAKLNNIINLSKKYLESFEIPVVPIQNQELICQEIKKINEIKNFISIKTQKEYAELFFSS